MTEKNVKLLIDLTIIPVVGSKVVGCQTNKKKLELYVSKKLPALSFRVLKHKWAT